MLLNGSIRSQISGSTDKHHNSSYRAILPKKTKEQDGPGLKISLHRYVKHSPTKTFL